MSTAAEAERDRRRSDRRAGRAASTAPGLVLLTLTAAAAAIAVAAAAAPARADTEHQTERPGERQVEHHDRWQGALGVRGSLVRDRGFDPFSAGDGLSQLSFTVLHTLRAGEGIVPAVGLALDLGGSDAAARSVDAQLGMWRLAVVLEPRVVPAPGFYLGARVAPGLLHVQATLRDPSAPAPIMTTYRTSSIDASLCGGARINPSASPVGLWLIGDGGYGWTPAHDLALKPSLPAGDAPKAGTTQLGTLAPRGLFLRASLAVSY